MPKQLLLRASVELPEDPFEAAKVIDRCGDAWNALKSNLRDTGIKHELRSEVIEVRAKVERAPRKSKAAKGRQAPTIPAELTQDPYVTRPQGHVGGTAKEDTLV